jgi:hypothetical protein
MQIINHHSGFKVRFPAAVGFFYFLHRSAKGEGKRFRTHVHKLNFKLPV